MPKPTYVASGSSVTASAEQAAGRQTPASFGCVTHSKTPFWRRTVALTPPMQYQVSLLSPGSEGPSVKTPWTSTSSRWRKFLSASWRRT